MTISLIMLTIAAIVFGIYSITMMMLSKGKIESLSESYYLLNDSKKGLGYIFSGLCLLLAGSIIYPMIELSNENWYMELLAFLTAGLLLFVAVSVEYREDMSSYIHYISAILMVLTSQVWIILDGGYDTVMLGSALTILLIIFDNDKYVFWTEAMFGILTIEYLAEEVVKYGI